MPPFFESFASNIIVFVLVLSRIGAMVSLAPIWGSRAVPMRIRAMLAVMISLIITPLHQASLANSDFLELTVAIAKESGLGLAMGATLTILFGSLQIAGQVIAQTSGLSLAESYDPSQDETTPVFSQLLDQLGLTVFVLLGGHRQALQAVLDSFATMPPGKADLPPDLVIALTDVLGKSCSMGIRIAGPVMLAMLISNLVLGLVSRALPQLNMMNMGLGVNAILALLVLALTLGSLPWLLEIDLTTFWWSQPSTGESTTGDPASDTATGLLSEIFSLGKR
jgi:flagellar biosynthetic protein FliR